MRDSIKIALGVILVVTVAVLLCVLVPALALLKLFLMLVAILLITAGVSVLNDLIHHHKCQQALREIELDKQRCQLPPPDHNQTSTAHHHDQARSRRLRGGRCCW